MCWNLRHHVDHNDVNQEFVNLTSDSSKHWPQNHHHSHRQERQGYQPSLWGSAQAVNWEYSESRSHEDLRRCTADRIDALHIMVVHDEPRLPKHQQSGVFAGQGNWIHPGEGSVK